MDGGGKWNAAASASCLALRGQDRRLSECLPRWLNRKWISGAGLAACVSAGVIRQAAASRQMPNPAETGSLYQQILFNEGGYTDASEAYNTWEASHFPPYVHTERVKYL